MENDNHIKDVKNIENESVNKCENFRQMVGKSENVNSKFLEKFDFRQKNLWKFYWKFYELLRNLIKILGGRWYPLWVMRSTTMNFFIIFYSASNISREKTLTRKYEQIKNIYLKKTNNNNTCVTNRQTGRQTETAQWCCKIEFFFRNSFN